MLAVKSCRVFAQVIYLQFVMCFTRLVSFLHVVRHASNFPRDVAGIKVILVYQISVSTLFIMVWCKRRASLAQGNLA